MVKFGAMEIYNEHVRDLLSVDPTPLRLLDDPEVRFITLKSCSHLYHNTNTKKAEKRF